jgi:hypothetical protein
MPTETILTDVNGVPRSGNCANVSSAPTKLPDFPGMDSAEARNAVSGTATSGPETGGRSDSSASRLPHQPTASLSARKGLAAPAPGAAGRWRPKLAMGRIWTRARKENPASRAAALVSAGRQWGKMARTGVLAHGRVTPWLR